MGEGLAELIGCARRLDPGLTARDFADAGRQLDRIDDDAFARHGLSGRTAGLRPGIPDGLASPGMAGFRSLGGNIAAGLKSLVGGEIGSYVKLNEDARRQAIDRMVRNAVAMGANAVTMMRFDSTEMAGP